MSQENREAPVIIVGSGPSGLATAGCLTALSIPYIILEREDNFAPLWTQKSYDCLHLHLKKQFCDLPHVPFSSSYPTYVPRKQYIQYLQDYMVHFKISPLYHRPVIEAFYDEAVSMWIVKVKNVISDEVEEYSCRFLVVATGESSDPLIPEVEGLDSFAGRVMHSTEYKSGKGFEDKRVMVVGAGNSGMEIAYDLTKYGVKTSLVVRSPVHILTREMVYIGPMLMMYLKLPIHVIDKIVVMLSWLVFGDLSKYGIKRPEEGPFTMKMKYGKFPTIDVGTHNKIKSGEIQVLPGIESIRGNEVFFKDGKSHPFDVIIFATGFKRTTKMWLKGGDDLLDDDGFAKRGPNNWKGKNGLYCAGLARRGLSGAKMDGMNIANDIKAMLSQ